MGTLRSQLEQIASNFVAEVLEAMRGSSLHELAEQSGQTSSRGASVASRGRRRATPAAVESSSADRKSAARRRRRATPDEVARQKDLALVAAKALKPGFSKGDVMQKANVKFDLGRALSLLVSEGKLIKKGDRRMTRYWVK